MEQVYLAHDTRLGRQVALKLLPPHLTGEAANIHYLVTEYIEGQTLRQMLSEPSSGSMPLPLAP